MVVINIVASDEKNGIGKDNTIPWKNKGDMKWFKDTTNGNIVIMGRITYNSLKCPLPGRLNCVISRTLNMAGADVADVEPNLMIFKSPLECITYCIKNAKGRKIFNIGGEQIYKWFLENNLVSEEYITNIEGDYKCDRHYHGMKSDKFNNYNYCIRSSSINSDNEQLNISHNYYHNVAEPQITNLCREILYDGDVRTDRTLIGNISLFGRQLRYSLVNNTIPLILNRKLFIRGVFEELMLYVRGETDSKILEDKKVSVWKPNTTREFLDKSGLNHLPVGDMGHSYGFSFRHFGANYSNCNSNYTGCGFDQLSYVINEININPNSRRLIISLWEPNHMHNAALPPCLYNYQFYVSSSDKLSCMMTQRSSDIVLAGGWNVATGSLLTHIIAAYTNLTAHELIWNIGDVHIYNNNIESIKELLKDTDNTNIYPTIFLNNLPEQITDLKWENIQILNYKPNKNIKLVMNA